MASLTLLLHLLLMVSAASAWWWENRYYGGSVTFTPKRRHSNGTYEVEIRDKQATRNCYHNNYNCYYGNCGDQNQSTTVINGYNYYYDYYCQSETVTRRKLNSNLPFAIRYPTYYNQQNGEGYWWYNSRGGWDIGLEMMAHVDLGTRSDTGESNRPPVMSTMPVLQIPSNCPRSFKLAMFDPDGDQVRCRVPTDPSTYECALCGLPNGFSLDQDSCSITYTPTYNRYGYGYYSGSGYYPIELMVEDFSRKYISLFYSDGSSTSKYPFSWRRHKRQDPYAYMTAPTTTTAAPTSTTAAPRTTTAAPTTTTAAPRTTTAAPRTSTAAPTTTTAPPTTTTPFPTTTLFPMTTTVAPTTTAVTITVPTATVPYPSWVPSLSKLPLQFMANVMWDEAPSCIEGEYIPIFLSPTPSNGAILPAFVNHTLEIKVRTSGIYTTIDDLVVTGPSGISKTRISTEEFVITWTPTEEDVNDYFPICFVSEAHMTNYSNYYYYYNNYYHYISYNYQSELRCVIAEVVPETTVTCSETTMTVEVKKTYLMRRYRDKLRLNAFTDPSCDLQTHSNWTHLVAIFPLNACGTSAEEDGDHIILSNTITSADPNQIIYRNNDIEIPFSCAYQRQANLTLGYRHKNTYSFTEEGFGAFAYQFEFYDSQLFINPINASSYPVEVDLKQMMFMQIEATISIPNTVLFVESCIATPYDNPNSPISYSIIKNGCVKDKTVQIYNGSNSQFRFGMEAFEFIGAYPQVYITCSVIMCQADVPGTRCSQGCLPFHHHSKREATAQTRSHSISQGPLHLRTSDSRASGLSLNLGINLFFIVGCLLVCGVVIYRSRRFRTNYQVLPMSDSE